MKCLSRLSLKVSIKWGFRWCCFQIGEWCLCSTPGPWPYFARSSGWRWAAWCAGWRGRRLGPCGEKSGEYAPDEAHPFQPRQPKRQEALSPELHGGPRDVQGTCNIFAQQPLGSFANNLGALNQAKRDASSAAHLSSTARSSGTRGWLRRLSPYTS